VIEERKAVEFLRRRWASAIRSGDDRTAARLRLQLDRALNGRLAQAPLRVVAESERPSEGRRENSDLLAAIWVAAGSGPRGARRPRLAAVAENMPGRIA
jgi:hypothetical protein